ncbi:hypothetical protein AMAG_00600 [Allomyces macrogynus ATCC 38327]|uniref:Cilia- and flagella-associated protein 69 ARM repeats domain-containing protein n=1 Tax=Allomyces macrogynus (strain ATCC 38327) TaxID=578462 RepID=A0A0L0RWZ7_ALLM3|nr:hypothetical protein AMAG_00600 [Allomyces macrogynus ATCC 38327]|eukprot:KNE54639.1 hypothetical protein AMAG_00600 [Allomyces macrogynus ATCC 38327]
MQVQPEIRSSRRLPPLIRSTAATTVGPGPSSRAHVSPNSINFAKIVTLFTDKHYREIHDRHVDVLEKLSRVYTHATIPDEHLDGLAQVLGLTLEMIENGVGALVTPLEDLLQTCTRDLSRKALSLDLVASFGRILTSPCIPPRSMQNLLGILSAASGQPEQLPILAHVLPALQHSLTSFDAKPVLKILLVWSESEAICRRMTMLDFSEPLRSVCASCSDPVTRLMALQLAFRVLTFEHESLDAWFTLVPIVEHDTPMLNDVLLLVYEILAARYTHHPDLIRFVLRHTAREIVAPHDDVLTASARSTAPAQSSRIQFEAKQVGFKLIDQFLVHSNSRDFLIEHHYVDFCLGYLTFRPQAQFDQRWTLRELKAIHVACLAHLTRLFGSGSLAQEAGNISCDPLLTTYLLDAQSLDNGQSDRPNAVNPSMGLVARFLQFAVTLCTYGASVQVKLGAIGLVQESIAILTRREPWVTETLKRGVCQLINALCDHECRANQLLVAQTNGVFSLVQMLSCKSDHPQRQELLRIAVLDAIWSAVCGCRHNEESFLEASGVYKLLDLLTHGERAVQSHVLSLVLELLENPKSRRHLVTWSSSKYRNSVELLLELWRKEQVTLKFDRALNALDEMKANLCGKIFGILSHIGFDAFRAQLCESNQRLLLNIERYLDFKVGVVWEEITYELASEGIRPVSPDARVLSEIKTAVQQKEASIASMQAELARKFADQEREREGHFFDEFMATHHIAKHVEDGGATAAGAAAVAATAQGAHKVSRGPRKAVRIAAGQEVLSSSANSLTSHHSVPPGQ